METHEPPLVTIRDLEREIPYYVAQMRAYAEATPDAVPEVIAGLGGMRYGIKEGSLKVENKYEPYITHPIWTRMKSLAI